jgi:hypothetical protein
MTEDILVVSEICDKEIDEKKEEKEEDDEKEVEKENSFSKNSIINVSRKSGIKCISQCGIDKIKSILNDKIKEMADKLSIFYSSKN